MTERENILVVMIKVGLMWWRSGRVSSLREGETEWDRETFRPRLEKQCRKMRKDKRDSGGTTSTDAKDRGNGEIEACPLTCSMHSAS